MAAGGMKSARRSTDGRKSRRAGRAGPVGGARQSCGVVDRLKWAVVQCQAVNLSPEVKAGDVYGAASTTEVASTTELTRSCPLLRFRLFVRTVGKKKKDREIEREKKTRVCDRLVGD